MIEYLDEMVKERIQLFRERNTNKLPTRIIYFRDGVSESQYAKVNEEELPLIRKACDSFSTNPKTPYKPKISIVVCSKRHHTRMYPTSADLTDSKGNSAPGTVVDRGITSIGNLDFFLQAHVGLQGTARSAHYFMTFDEIGFSADTLQGLVHNMSYLFARATKAVSYVPPAYYADILCERGRCYLQGLLSGRSDNHSDAMSDTTAASGETNKKLKEEQEARAVMAEATIKWDGGPKDDVRKLMFYM